MRKLILLSVVTFAIAACNKDNPNPVANVKAAATDPSLQEKTFVSECSAKPLEGAATGLLTGGQSSVKAMRVAYRVAGEGITRSERYYNALDCTGDAAYTFDEKGSIRLETDPNKKSNDGGRNIDIVYNKVGVEIGSDAGATAANATKMCGASDWKMKDKRDVTARAKDITCYGAQLPRTIYNVYRVDGDTLYLGKASIKPNDRPAKLDMTTKYIKQ